MMTKLVFYWRIFCVVSLVCLLLTSIIGVRTFVSVIATIIVFHGIPLVIKKYNIYIES